MKINVSLEASDRSSKESGGFGAKEEAEMLALFTNLKRSSSPLRAKSDAKGRMPFPEIPFTERSLVGDRLLSDELLNLCGLTNTVSEIIEL